MGSAVNGLGARITRIGAVRGSGWGLGVVRMVRRSGGDEAERVGDVGGTVPCPHGAEEGWG